MAKTSINMRLDSDLLDAAKRALGLRGTTATVEAALRNSINNRKAIFFLRKASGQSKWTGLSQTRNER